MYTRLITFDRFATLLRNKKANLTSFGVLSRGRGFDTWRPFKSSFLIFIFNRADPIIGFNDSNRKRATPRRTGPEHGHGHGHGPRRVAPVRPTIRDRFFFTGISHRDHHRFDIQSVISGSNDRDRSRVVLDAFTRTNCNIFRPFPREKYKIREISLQIGGPVSNPNANFVLERRILHSLLITQNKYLLAIIFAAFPIRKSSNFSVPFRARTRKQFLRYLRPLPVRFSIVRRLPENEKKKKSIQRYRSSVLRRNRTYREHVRVRF